MFVFSQKSSYSSEKLNVHCTLSKHISSDQHLSQVKHQEHTQSYYKRHKSIPVNAVYNFKHYIDASSPYLQKSLLCGPQEPANPKFKLKLCQNLQNSPIISRNCFQEQTEMYSLGTSAEIFPRGMLHSKIGHILSYIG